MIRYHEEGGDAVPRMPRRRLLRLLGYFLIPLTLLYILVAYEPVPLPLLHTSKKIQYDLHPTYEYVSLYRQKSDLAFEKALDEQLRSLERYTISQLPYEQQNLATNLTIWQITTPTMADALKVWTSQWKDNNQDWFYNLFTSPPADLYAHFEGIPEIGAMNETSQTVQDDLTRYLLLWYHGGFYTEIDTWDRVAMRDCGPVATVLANQQDISLMIGIETDEPYLSTEQLRKWQWARGFGFGQSSMWAAMRFDPMLRKAIVRTISHARTQKTLAKESWMEKYISRVDYSGEVSGKGMFTDVVLETLSKNLKDDHKMRDREAGLERRVTWKKFRALQEVLWMDVNQTREDSEDEIRGLAVLPINIWGSGQSHSKSASFEHPDACVNHVPGFRPRQSWKEKAFG